MSLSFKLTFPVPVVGVIVLSVIVPLASTAFMCIKNLLSYELHYKKVKNLSKYHDRNKYCILFTGDPSKKFIKNLISK